MSETSGPDAGGLEPVVQESTPSVIASRIREAIASGVIAPGSQIGEAEYARRLGVSRGPLREGLQRLCQEGLLVAQRNRGHFVIEMTPETVEDTYLARAAIERAAAARVHQRNPTAAAKALLAIVSDMEAAAQRGDERGVSEADVAFHKVMVAEAGSPRLQRIHDTLMAETRMCMHALEPTYAVGGVRVKEHRRIARAFTSDDPAVVDRMLLEHMDDAVSRLANIARLRPSGTVGT